MNSSRRLLLAGVAIAVLFSGCSTNKAGDTTCKDFKSQDTSKQNSEITEMLKNQHGGKEPSSMEVSATRLSALAFCKTVGHDSSKISDINHG